MPHLIEKKVERKKSIVVDNQLKIFFENFVFVRDLLYLKCEVKNI